MCVLLMCVMCVRGSERGGVSEKVEVLAKNKNPKPRMWGKTIKGIWKI